MWSHDILNHMHEETLMKLKTLQTDFDQLKSEYDTLLEVHRQSAPAVLHSNQSVLQHGSDNKHTVTTPRPNWEQCSDKAGEWAYILMESIQNNLEDDLISLCNDILTGKDTDGRHKEFLSLVKKQATSERVQYISEMRVQLEGKG
ncbi:hypothetical protein cypCar_00004962 [Cyprinus carpio]|nr:hypothetical protein cypCar_00004962 [Cyprinus carpio]